MKKYSLTKTTKEWCGTTLFQIKAEKDFGDVSKGDLGGYIEKEDNLSQHGNAWIYGNARVSGKLKINFVLCSKFEFEFNWQVKLWKKLEAQFEKENNKRLKRYEGDELE